MLVLPAAGCCWLLLNAAECCRLLLNTVACCWFRGWLLVPLLPLLLHNIFCTQWGCWCCACAELDIFPTRLLTRSFSLTSKASMYSIGSMARQVANLSEIAWSEVRKVPYTSENRDKKQLADLMLQQDRGQGTEELEKLVGAQLGVNYVVRGPGIDSGLPRPLVAVAVLTRARFLDHTGVRSLVESPGWHERPGHPSAP